MKHIIALLYLTKKKRGHFESWSAWTWVKGQDELLEQSITESIIILHMGNAHACVTL